ncbi:MAG: hypothetical protein IJY36_04005 [Coprobacter sp.]|nr:hypothetical protein [Coprobacter sp.]
MEYKLNDLLSFDIDNFRNLKGCHVEIETTNDQMIDGIVTGFGLAANPPYLVCSIMIDNKKDVLLQTIKKLSYEK